MRVLISGQIVLTTEASSFSLRPHLWTELRSAQRYCITPLSTGCSSPTMGANSQWFDPMLLSVRRNPEE